MTIKTTMQNVKVPDKNWPPIKADSGGMIRCFFCGRTLRKENDGWCARCLRWEEQQRVLADLEKFAWRLKARAEEDQQQEQASKGMDS